MSTYSGVRTDAGCVVTVDGKPLGPRLDLFNHSPTGFEWGYFGSGPAQLALAIVAHHSRRLVKETYGAASFAVVVGQLPITVSRREAFRSADRFAVRVHQAFKAAIVGRLPNDGWTLTTDDVAAALAPLVDALQEIRA